MKVSFTAKEYQRLIELTWLGLHVVGARADDPASMPERYAGLAQKVYEYAQPLGCADCVEADVDGTLYPNEKITDGPAGEKLDLFVEDAFWSELVARLAERDLRAELGPTKIGDELNDEETERLHALEGNYWREFETRGVDNLVLLRGGRG